MLVRCVLEMSFKTTRNPFTISVSDGFVRVLRKNLEYIKLITKQR